MKEIKLFINGEFKDSSSNETFKSFDPATSEQIAICHNPTINDVDAAVQAAHSAFYAKEWSETTGANRSEILLSISENIKARKKELIEWEIKDSGSLVRKATADIFNAASFFKVMSKTALKLELEVKDENASRDGFSQNYRTYLPVGVCAQIIPWNFPLVMAAWKIGPILATGCTSVLKSAAETPITASILAEILQSSGVPKGVINIITGDASIGSHLIDHPLVDKVAFTGSTQTGKMILNQTAKSVKKSTMELGGKSANIVLADADLDIAVDGALYAFLYHSGQACDSGTRLLVQEDIYPQFIERFLKRIQQVPIGTTTDKSAGMGPVINEKQYNTIMSYINKTKDEKAPLLCGGQRLETLHDGSSAANGYYIAPTVFEITADNTIFAEEIFGPVVGVTKFKTTQEAIELANNSNYGLAAAIWTQNLELGRSIARKIQAGTVWINEYHLLNPGMPFGGFKQSGLGREMGLEGIHSYLEVQHRWESDCNARDKKPWFDAIF